MYFISLPLQIITTGSFLEQGSTALTVLTAIHAGIMAAAFWALLGNAIVATQVVEDGTLSSIIVRDFSPNKVHRPALSTHHYVFFSSDPKHSHFPS